MLLYLGRQARLQQIQGQTGYRVRPYYTLFSVFVSRPFPTSKALPATLLEAPYASLFTSRFSDYTCCIHT